MIGVDPSMYDREGDFDEGRVQSQGRAGGSLVRTVL
jgi:hypothetical protein